MIEEKKFRYSTKQEYEEHLVRLVKTKPVKKKKTGSKNTEYDEILEEYLEFCEKHVRG